MACYLCGGDCGNCERSEKARRRTLSYQNKKSKNSILDVNKKDIKKED